MWAKWSGISLTREAKGNLWVEETAYQLVSETPDGRKWLMEHEHAEELVRFKDEKHEFVFHSLR
jgi:hypothetical protein